MARRTTKVTLNLDDAKEIDDLLLKLFAHSGVDLESIRKTLAEVASKYPEDHEFVKFWRSAEAEKERTVKRARTAWDKMHEAMNKAER